MSIEQRIAVVTGFTGQDSSYLAELLLTKDYKVYGVKRRTSDNNLGCSAHLAKQVEVVESDLTDLSSLCRLVKSARPHEFYNLAAQSHVGTSFEQPLYTMQVTGMGVINCLEAIRLSGLHTRFFQASTSELYGGMKPETYNEQSTFHPRSPYGVAKLAGYWATVNYREAYRMFACQAICFNHESPRRGPNFVTRKITRAIAEIKAGRQTHVTLGNIDACRDWGHAEDYVDAMWRIMQAPLPGDYVVATGETHSVRDFLKLAFEHAGLENYGKYVETDPALYRPAEVNVLIGDASKIRNELGWFPRYAFNRLVADMVDADLAAAGLPLGGR